MIRMKCKDNLEHQFLKPPEEEKKKYKKKNQHWIVVSQSL